MIRVIGTGNRRFAVGPSPVKMLIFGPFMRLGYLSAVTWVWPYCWWTHASVSLCLSLLGAVGAWGFGFARGTDLADAVV